jgi:hypothetical protein
VTCANLRGAGDGNRPRTFSLEVDRLQRLDVAGPSVDGVSMARSCPFVTARGRNLWPVNGPLDLGRSGRPRRVQWHTDREVAEKAAGRNNCLLPAPGNTLAGVSGLTELERRCVLPFYLKMMGRNALRHDDSINAVRDVARTTTDEEVGYLLASSWRPRVMGAWLTAGRAHRLEAALLNSLETSAGSLTAPPLATIALHGLGHRAAPSLVIYLDNDLKHQLGAAPFIAAVLERLDARPASVPIDDRIRAAVDGMLAIADRIADSE